MQILAALSLDIEALCLSCLVYPTGLDVWVRLEAPLDSRPHWKEDLSCGCSVMSYNIL